MVAAHFLRLSKFDQGAVPVNPIQMAIPNFWTAVTYCLIAITRIWPPKFLSVTGLGEKAPTPCDLGRPQVFFARVFPVRDLPAGTPPLGPDPPTDELQRSTAGSTS